MSCITKIAKTPSQSQEAVAPRARTTEVEPDKVIFLDPTNNEKIKTVFNTFKVFAYTKAPHFYVTMPNDPHLQQLTERSLVYYHPDPVLGVVRMQSVDDLAKRGFAIFLPFTKGGDVKLAYEITRQDGSVLMEPFVKEFDIRSSK